MPVVVSPIPTAKQKKAALIKAAFRDLGPNRGRKLPCEFGGQFGNVFALELGDIKLVFRRGT